MGLLESGEVHPRYASAWNEILNRSVAQICEALVATGEHAVALRQCSPFAGALDSKTRWKIWREVGTSFGSPGPTP